MKSRERRERHNEYLRAYRQRPDVKEKMRAYYQRPEVKARPIQRLMAKYNISEAEARIVRSIRTTASFRGSAEGLARLKELIYREEGPAFAEMVLDGIPERKAEREEK